MTADIITTHESVDLIRKQVYHKAKGRAAWLARRQAKLVNAIIKTALSHLPEQYPVFDSPFDRHQFVESIEFQTIQDLRGREFAVGVYLQPVSSSQWQFTLERAIADIVDFVVVEYFREAD